MEQIKIEEIWQEVANLIFRKTGERPFILIIGDPVNTDQVTHITNIQNPIESIHILKRNIIDLEKYVEMDKKKFSSN